MRRFDHLAPILTAAALSALPSPLHAQASSAQSSAPIARGGGAGADPYDTYYASKFSLDSGHSVIAFSLPFAGLTLVEGRFKEFDGTLMLDPADISRSSISVTITAQSLDTAEEDRDKDLRSANFFACERFPVITFRSSRVERRDGGLVVTGPLTLHGVTREVAIPFTWVGDRLDGWRNHRIALRGAFALNRGDYGIGGFGNFGRMSDPMIPATVNVRLEVQAAVPNYELRTGSERSIAGPIERVLAEKGLAAAQDEYRRLRREQPGAYDFGIGELRLLGYQLLQRKRLAEAAGILRLNADSYPESFAAQGALAVALASAGQPEPAREACRKALALNPNFPLALEVLRRLESPRPGGAGAGRS
jgi:polyisoprenoid-binding protein YceI